jgi:hypothetical protein
MEPECQSLDLHQHPDQNIHKKEEKKVPGETSHGLLPTYLVWNKDQGDVVPP